MGNFRFLIKKRLLPILFFCLLSLECFAQSDESSAKNHLRIVFYNAENYFDPFNDSVKNDDAFTFEGQNHWSYKRFETKRNNLYKTITALGGWSPPAVVGLCEIENNFVLKELCNNTPLSKSGYRFAHFESPDARGIDVALLYRKELFRCIEARPISIVFPFDTAAKTRDILYVKGIVFENDTIHIYVNHFPSRLGGETANRRRNYVASVLKKSVDSLFARNSASNIIIMGDFNDEATDYSMRGVLKISLFGETDTGTFLQNSFDRIPQKEGSYKYQGEWSMIDQLIVSKALSDGKGSLCMKDGQSFIFKGDFLLMEDEKYFGRKPFRTYTGLQYTGGFSDHLPIYLDLIKCPQ